MPITFFCPSGHRLSVPKRNVGQQVRCPVCNQKAIVPELEDDNEPTKGDLTELGREDSASIPPPLPKLDLPDQSPRKPADLRQSRESETLERRAGLRRESEPLPSNAYRPDRGHIQTARWLGVILILLVTFTTIPVARHTDLETAPSWARIVLILAGIQAFYILWMVATPDWSSVWVVMLVFACSAAIYGTATAIAMATPLDKPLPLGLGDLRNAAPRWCGCVLLFMSLGTYLSGHTSAKWRRSFELEMAGRD